MSNNNMNFLSKYSTTPNFLAMPQSNINNNHPSAPAPSGKYSKTAPNTLRFGPARIPSLIPITQPQQQMQQQHAQPLQQQHHNQNQNQPTNVLRFGAPHQQQPPQQQQQHQQQSFLNAPALQLQQQQQQQQRPTNLFSFKKQPEPGRLLKDVIAEATSTATNTPSPASDPYQRRFIKKLKDEFSSLVEGLQIRQRTALLRKRSLEDYELALRDVSSDPGAQKAIELWKVLDDASATINSKLQEIRDKFEHSPPRAARRGAAAAASIATNDASLKNITVESACDLLYRRSCGEFAGQLLPFQEESLAFFLNLNSRGAHGICADDMGLGKTVQAISLIVATRALHRLRSGQPQPQQQQQQRQQEQEFDLLSEMIMGSSKTRGNQQRPAPKRKPANNNNTSNKKPFLIPPSIVVAPLSTASSWAHEFKTFAPSLRVGVLGSAEDRASMLRQFFREDAPVVAAAATAGGARPKRRGRKDETSSSSEEEEDDDDGEDDSSEDDDEEPTSSSSSSSEDDDDTSDDSDRAAARRRKRQRLIQGGGGGRGGGRGRGRGGGGGGGTAAATASATGKTPRARINAEGYGFDVLVVPHHFFSMQHQALSKQYIPKLVKTEWFYCVVDEAHRIKNDEAALTWTLQQFHSVQHRLVLTGTPLQNQLGELWTLLSFLLPEVFAKAQFTSLFKAIAELHEVPELSELKAVEAETAAAANNNKKKKPQAKQQQQQQQLSALDQERARALTEERQFLLCRKIHDVLLPLMVRREKRDVITELPQLTEWVVECPSASLQMLEAKMILENRRAVAEVEAVKQARKQQQQQQQKRENSSSSDHAEGEDNELLLIEEEAAAQQQQQQQLQVAGHNNQNQHIPVFSQLRMVHHPFLLRKHQAVQRLLYDEPIQQNLFRGSGKLVILDLFLRFIRSYNEHQQVRYQQMVGEQLAPDAMESTARPRPHKVLIFSQFTQLLDLVETHVGWCRGWPYLRLDGSTAERGDMLDEFQTNDDQFVFLLSKGAGGVGLNLQAADTVVMLDVDYNPTNDAQAIARAYRVGQKRDVLVLRLISSDFPAEVAALSIAVKKQELEQRVIRAGKFDIKTEDEVRDEELRQLVFSTAGAAAAAAASNGNAETANTNGCNSLSNGMVVPSLAAAGTKTHARVSRCKLSASPEMTDNSNAVREALSQHILRFFPRTEHEHNFLQFLIRNTDLLNDAVAALTPTANPNPPHCLRIDPEADSKTFKQQVMKKVEEDEHGKVLAPRAARLEAEGAIEIERNLETSSSDDFDDDDEDGDDFF